MGGHIISIAEREEATRVSATEQLLSSSIVLVH